MGEHVGQPGAALSPVILTAINRLAGWEGAFAACATAFVFAGICGLLLDATRPVNPADDCGHGK